jgi:hypothetical protein
MRACRAGTAPFVVGNLSYGAETRGPDRWFRWRLSRAVTGRAVDASSLKRERQRVPMGGAQPELAYWTESAGCGEHSAIGFCVGRPQRLPW